MVAKLRAKGAGKYLLFDNGANPNNSKKSQGKAIRRQMGCCKITNLGALEPIKMRALLPKTEG